MFLIRTDHPYLRVGRHISAPLKLATHRKSCTTSFTFLTFLILLGTKSKMVGAISLILLPLSHRSFQNNIFEPSPTLVMSAISKRHCTSLHTCIWNWFHDFSGSVSCSHGHLTRRAQLNFRMSKRLSPPSSFGRVTLAHAIRQCPSP
jgi:hypothetical protein